MYNNNSFDVLNIHDDNGNVDMIQSLMGSDCLGAYFKNGTAKLYFQGGIKNVLQEQLQRINSNFLFEWKWEKQNQEDWHQKLFVFDGLLDPIFECFGTKMVPKIDLNLASKASSNRFASILKNHRKHGKGHQKSRFGEEENNK